MEIEYIKPDEIEKRSMQIIEKEMETKPRREHLPVVRRVIHTTADFEYEHNLVFSDTAVASALAALRGKSLSSGAGDSALDESCADPSHSELSGGADGPGGNGTTIVTDTNMALSGINKKALRRLGCRAVCYMAEPEVAEAAASRGVTRAAVSMERAAELEGRLIFAIGNAPTALIRLKELIEAGEVRPELVIGVPVGFVNVTEAKELFLGSDIPHIIARGRKGGSTVAAAICNALLYMAEDPSF